MILKLTANGFNRKKIALSRRRVAPKFAKADYAGNSWFIKKDAGRIGESVRFSPRSTSTVYLFNSIVPQTPFAV